MEVYLIDYIFSKEILGDWYLRDHLFSKNVNLIQSSGLWVGCSNMLWLGHRISKSLFITQFQALEDDALFISICSAVVYGS